MTARGRHGYVLIRCTHLNFILRRWMDVAVYVGKVQFRLHVQLVIGLQVWRSHVIPRVQRIFGLRVETNFVHYQERVARLKAHFEYPVDRFLLTCRGGSLQRRFRDRVAFEQIEFVYCLVVLDQ